MLFRKLFRMLVLGRRRHRCKRGLLRCAGQQAARRSRTPERQPTAGPARPRVQTPKRRRLRGRRLVTETQRRLVAEAWAFRTRVEREAAARFIRLATEISRFDPHSPCPR